ncbi:integrase catalytic domain-containing protein [Trichonephila clavipes]|nr:integrase catalytic domain-containing protein [Trichonephila clavipes]
MKSAFNQIPLHFADRHKTAFFTPDVDKYEFNRLCFGLKNTPKAFQSIAQEVLGDLLHNGALVYIDDVILFTKTIDEHFELLEFGGHLKFIKTYHRLSENFFWQNMYKDTKNFVRSCTVCLSRKNAFKIPPAPHQRVEQSQEPGETCHIDIFGPLKTTPKELIFNKVLRNLKEQEASHIDLSTRATKQHHYGYKIGSLCFIKTPNIKSNLSPKLRPKFEGPYRVIERFSNVNYRVQHVEQLRKRFNTPANRMIPFIKRFSYLHLNNLDDLQPDDTELKSIVPSPRYNLRARAGNSAY